MVLIDLGNVLINPANITSIVELPIETDGRQHVHVNFIGGDWHDFVLPVGKTLSDLSLDITRQTGVLENPLRLA